MDWLISLTTRFAAKVKLFTSDEVKQTFYEDIDLEKSLKKEFKSINHVVHCLLWFEFDDSQKPEIEKKNSKEFEKYFCLMILREDGLIGFPGGGLDESVNRVEDIVQGLNRELKEEINCDIHVDKKDYAFTYVLVHKGNKKHFSHFFVKKLCQEEFENIESKSSKARDYMHECLGILRVSLKDKVFLDNFLQSNIFCGNSREQLVRSIESITKTN